ncbi:ATP-binding protein [Pseudobacillus badius]|uniref:ATP-binding protein n=1 Tax=Bacillus badius TaxID=1455 RepID=UPI001CBF91BF|nr:ATP-binding protein [Bacillus badius]
MARKFTSIAEVMADLQEKASQRMMSIGSSKKPEEPGVDEYECSICKDTELIYYQKESTNDLMYTFSKPCECRERKAWKRRFKQSMIPEEFTQANFENYETPAAVQKEMLALTKEYRSLFKIIQQDGQKKKVIPADNFGLVAVIGEQRLKEMPSKDRATLKQKHNNYGIGKTHLQIALAKQLIKEGFNVLTVSDVTFIEELMQAKKMDDGGETYNHLLNGALSADVLIWDDIGKVNWTEPRERMYYTIINERYRRQKPIVFNSNEDRGTLADKIGYAGASRLIGECGKYLLDAEGIDWRLKR